MSEASLEKAFLQFQQSISPVTKKGKNPHYKSTYSRYEDVVAHISPLLVEVGLSFRHTSRESGEHWYVGTKLVHAESNTTSEVFEMPCALGKMQEMGSALTYAKRYTLMALLGLPSEDDDGHKASHPQPVKKASEAKPTAEDLNRLYKLVDAKNWEPTEVKDIMLKAFNCDVTSKLTMKDYVLLYKTIEQKTYEQALEEII